MIAPVQETMHLFSGFFVHESNPSGDPCITKDGLSIASDGWIGVFVSDDHFLNSRPHESLCARRCTAVMIARLECYIGGGTVGGVPLFFGIVNCHLLSMEATEVIVPSFSDDLAFFDKYAADQGIGAYLSPAPFSDQESTFHEHAIGITPRFLHMPSTMHQFKTSCIGEARALLKFRRFMHYE